jgi:hypothetical protein
MGETPLVKKLGIKPGQRALVLNAPSGYLDQLGTLPEGVTLATAPAGVYDFVQVFVADRAAIERAARPAIAALRHGGLLWFAYPKKSSKVSTDVTRDVGWDTVADVGFGPVTQIAIDDVWSALRFKPRA